MEIAFLIVLPRIVLFLVSLFPDRATTVFIRSDDSSTPVQLQSQLQAVAVKVFLGRFYTLCSLYLPPDVAIIRPHLDALVHDLSSPFLILRDFNGRHHLCH